MQREPRLLPRKIKRSEGLASAPVLMLDTYLLPGINNQKTIIRKENIYDCMSDFNQFACAVHPCGSHFDCGHCLDNMEYKKGAQTRLRRLLRLLNGLLLPQFLWESTLTKAVSLLQSEAILRSKAKFPMLQSKEKSAIKRMFRLLSPWAKLPIIITSKAN